MVMGTRAGFALIHQLARIFFTRHTHASVKLPLSSTVAGYIYSKLLDYHCVHVFCIGIGTKVCP